MRRIPLGLVLGGVIAAVGVALATPPSAQVDFTKVIADDDDPGAIARSDTDNDTLGLVTPPVKIGEWYPSAWYFDDDASTAPPSANQYQWAAHLNLAAFTATPSGDVCVGENNPELADGFSTLDPFRRLVDVGGDDVEVVVGGTIAGNAAGGEPTHTNAVSAALVRRTLPRLVEVDVPPELSGASELSFLTTGARQDSAGAGAAMDYTVRFSFCEDDPDPDCVPVDVDVTVGLYDEDPPVAPSGTGVTHELRPFTLQTAGNGVCPPPPDPEDPPAVGNGWLVRVEVPDAPVDHPVLSTIRFSYTALAIQGGSPNFNAHLPGPLSVSLALAEEDYADAFGYYTVVLTADSVADALKYTENTLPVPNTLFHTISWSAELGEGAEDPYSDIFLEYRCADTVAGSADWSAPFRPLPADGALEAGEGIRLRSNYDAQSETWTGEAKLGNETCAGEFLQLRVYVVSSGVATGLATPPRLLSVEVDVDADRDQDNVTRYGAVTPSWDGSGNLSGLTHNETLAEPDCNDNNPAVYPGQTQDTVVPDSGPTGTVDFNCSGTIPCYRDFDGDGDGIDDVVQKSVGSEGASGSCKAAAVESNGYSDNKDDCYDPPAAVSDTTLAEAGREYTKNNHFGTQAVESSAAEVLAGTGVVLGNDYDCDGEVACYVDEDQDSFGRNYDFTGETDEWATDYEYDATGLTPSIEPKDRCDVPSAKVSGNAEDCDDDDFDIKPGIAQLGVPGGAATHPGFLVRDNNCDGMIKCYLDADADGDGASPGVLVDVTIDPSDPLNPDHELGPDGVSARGGHGTCDGSKGLGYSGNTADCLDANPGAPAGQQPELFTFNDLRTTRGTEPTVAQLNADPNAFVGLDYDCDGNVVCFEDGDGDGFGRGYGTSFATEFSVGADPLAGCQVPSLNVSSNFSDCDDSLAAINPAQAQVGVPAAAASTPNTPIRDTNCTGTIQCYEDLDADGDGGALGVLVAVAVEPGVQSGHVAGPDTNDPARGGTATCDGSKGLGYAGNTDDCWDAVVAPPNENVLPEQFNANNLRGTRLSEAPVGGVYAGFDYDCSNSTLCFNDADGDGFGFGSAAPVTVAWPDVIETTTSGITRPVSACEQTGRAPIGGDCNDSTAADPTGQFANNGQRFNPGSTLEALPENFGVDFNCDNILWCFRDADGDEWGVETRAYINGAAAGTGSFVPGAVLGTCARPVSLNAGRIVNEAGTSALPDVATAAPRPSFAGALWDCRDDDPLINPGVADGPVGSGADLNCSGTVQCFLDRDRDGDGDGATIIEVPLGAAQQPGATRNCRREASGAPWNISGDAAYNDAIDAWLANPVGTPPPTAANGDDCRDLPAAGSATDGRLFNTNNITPAVGNNRPVETPQAGADYNCDNQLPCFVDADGDGFGVGPATVVRSFLDELPGFVDPTICRTQDTGFANVDGDCNDDLAQNGQLYFPGAPEEPGDQADFNCNGILKCFVDEDGDGFGQEVADPLTDTSNVEPFTLSALGLPAGHTDPLFCESQTVGGSSFSATADDCDDSRSDVNPGRPTDTPANGGLVQPPLGGAVNSGARRSVDANCDGVVACFRDRDDDGYGSGFVVNVDIGVRGGRDLFCNDPGASGYAAAVIPPSTGPSVSLTQLSWRSDDCRDAPVTGFDPADFYPGAPESVGPLADFNCDAQLTCYRDDDGDGFGSSRTRVVPGGLGRQPGFLDTCEDIGPDASVSVASNALDCRDCVTFDTAGDSCLDSIAALAINAGINPGASEVLESGGFDEDCSGDFACWADTDQDGFGDEATCLNDPDGTGAGCTAWAIANYGSGNIVNGQSTSGCLVNQSHSSNGDDCHDDRAQARPGAFFDINPATYTIIAVVTDASSPVAPGAVRVSEVPGNAFDDNCDEVVACLQDFDNDGWGRYGNPSTLASFPGEFVAALTNTRAPGQPYDCSTPTNMAPRRILSSTNQVAFDCNDNDNQIFPGAPELPGTSTDNNCDGVVACFVDFDGDGFGGSTEAVNLSDTPFDVGYRPPDNEDINLVCSRASGFADNGDDCHDNNRFANPNATERPGHSPRIGDTVIIDGVGRRIGPAGHPDCPSNDCENINYCGGVLPNGDFDLSCYGRAFDDDCDGRFDCYLDEDRDTFGTHAVSVCGTAQLCSNVPNGEDAGPWAPGLAAVQNGIRDLTCASPADELAPVGGLPGEPNYDCHPLDAEAFPGNPAGEIPGDGLDNNCSGAIACYIDTDGDKFGRNETSSSPYTLSNPATSQGYLPGPNPEGYFDCDLIPRRASSKIDDRGDEVFDCHDNNFLANPARNAEVPGHSPRIGDTVTLPGVSGFERRVTSTFLEAFSRSPQTVTVGPGQFDLCGNNNDGCYNRAFDDNCDGFVACYRDADGNGVGAGVVTDERGYRSATGGAPQQVSAADVQSQLDGLSPQASWSFTCNITLPGAGNNSARRSAVGGANPTDPGYDCHDNNPDVFPSVGTFTAPAQTQGHTQNPNVSGTDGFWAFDTNCDGTIACFEDLDRDSFGTAVIEVDVSQAFRTSADFAQYDCDRTAAGERANRTYRGGPGTTAFDCHDNNPSAFPGATEVPGGVFVNNRDYAYDEDCNGFFTCYEDNDDDTYGRGTINVAVTDFFASRLGATLPERDRVNPPGVGGAMSQHDNGVLRCGWTSDRATVASPDTRGTFVWADGSNRGISWRGAGADEDCHDFYEHANPGRSSDTPGNADPDPGHSLYMSTAGRAFDDNCDGVVQCFRDFDGDTYGTYTVTFDQGGVDAPGNFEGDASNRGTIEKRDPAGASFYLCDNPTLLTAGRGGSLGSPDWDCHDDRASINPGAGNSEVAGDIFDNNCSGVVDCFWDLDNDDYGSVVASINYINPAANTPPGSPPNQSSLNLGSFRFVSAPQSRSWLRPVIPADAPGADVEARARNAGLQYFVCGPTSLLDQGRPVDAADRLALNLDNDRISGRGGAGTPDYDCHDDWPGANPGVLAEVPGDPWDNNCDGFVACYADVDGDGFGSSRAISFPRSELVSNTFDDFGFGNVFPASRPSGRRLSQFPTELSPGLDAFIASGAVAERGVRRGADDRRWYDCRNETLGVSPAGGEPGTRYYDCHDDVAFVIPSGIRPDQRPALSGPRDTACGGAAMCVYPDALADNGFGFLSPRLNGPDPTALGACPAGVTNCTVQQQCSALGGTWRCFAGNPAAGDNGERPGDPFDNDCDGLVLCFDDVDNDGVGTVPVVDDGSPASRGGTPGDDGWYACTNFRDYTDGQGNSQRRYESPVRGDCHDDNGDVFPNRNPSGIPDAGGATHGGGAGLLTSQSYAGYPTASSYDDPTCPGTVLCYTEASGGAPEGLDNRFSRPVCAAPSQLLCFGRIGGENLQSFIRISDYPIASSYDAAYDTSGAPGTCAGPVMCFNSSTNAVTDRFQNPSCSEPAESLRCFQNEITGDAFDHDCDGVATCFFDADGDGFGVEQAIRADALRQPAMLGPFASQDPGRYTCQGPDRAPRRTENGNLVFDCNDSNPLESPDGVEVAEIFSLSSSALRAQAFQSVGNNLDENCDGRILCWEDLDGDGFGAGVVEPGLSGAAAVAAAVGGKTSRNELHRVWNVVERVYQSDGTGKTCVPEDSSDRFSFRIGDCDDSRSAVNPGASEVPGDNLDNNCDGQWLCFNDRDQDGFGDNGVLTGGNNTIPDQDPPPKPPPSLQHPDIGDGWNAICANTSLGESVNNLDCLDDVNSIPVSQARTYPLNFNGQQEEGVTTSVAALTRPVVDGGPPGVEIFGDGIDGDCDGFELCFVDRDRDGFVDGGAASVSLRDPLDRFGRTVPRAATAPGRGLIPCTGQVPDPEDPDADPLLIAGWPFASGFAAGADPFLNPNTGFAIFDCDDGNPDIFPGAPEVWYDGVDQNCDNRSDFDQDRDGYDDRLAVIGRSACGDTLPAEVNPVTGCGGGGDCNDLPNQGEAIRRVPYPPILEEAAEDVWTYLDTGPGSSNPVMAQVEAIITAKLGAGSSLRPYLRVELDVTNPRQSIVEIRNTIERVVRTTGNVEDRVRETIGEVCEPGGGPAQIDNDCDGNPNTFRTCAFRFAAWKRALPGYRDRQIALQRPIGQLSRERFSVCEEDFGEGRYFIDRRDQLDFRRTALEDPDTYLEIRDRLPGFIWDETWTQPSNSLGPFYPDQDGDNEGDQNFQGVFLCTQSAEVAREIRWVRTRRDCNDQNPLINPGADELCDRIDNNCDGQIDEPTLIQLDEDPLDPDCIMHYLDADGDGWGARELLEPFYRYCICPRWEELEFDDAGAIVEVARPEVCPHFREQDVVSGEADVEPVFGYTIGGACYVQNNLDCDDNNNEIKPFAPGEERFEYIDGIDNDCDNNMPLIELDCDDDNAYPYLPLMSANLLDNPGDTPIYSAEEVGLRRCGGPPPTVECWGQRIPISCDTTTGFWRVSTVVLTEAEKFSGASRVARPSNCVRWDCDDQCAARCAGIEEVCDGIDNDCNDYLQELVAVDRDGIPDPMQPNDVQLVGFVSPGELDFDGDQHITCTNTVSDNQTAITDRVCNTYSNFGDCNDSCALASPAADEDRCNGFVTTDTCAELTDSDRDGDGYRTCGTFGVEREEREDLYVLVFSQGDLVAYANNDIDEIDVLPLIPPRTYGNHEAASLRDPDKVRECDVPLHDAIVARTGPLPASADRSREAMLELCVKADTCRVLRDRNRQASGAFDDAEREDDRIGRGAGDLSAAPPPTGFAELPEYCDGLEDARCSIMQLTLNADADEGIFDPELYPSGSCVFDDAGRLAHPEQAITRTVWSREQIVNARKLVVDFECYRMNGTFGCTDDVARTLEATGEEWRTPYNTQRPPSGGFFRLPDVPSRAYSQGQRWWLYVDRYAPQTISGRGTLMGCWGSPLLGGVSAAQTIDIVGGDCVPDIEGRSRVNPRDANRGMPEGPGDLLALYTGMEVDCATCLDGIDNNCNELVDAEEPACARCFVGQGYGCGCAAAPGSTSLGRSAPTAIVVLAMLLIAIRRREET